ncbi:uncharacterized protein LOC119270370 [Triticum dicoccoides]|uniref:uncharacterized protein LOC119270370 n=1 Tax=Triticum dicoccoides TaxID=85692 RepID=UPI00188DF7B3|nr:uncharacterized protein LOC119270370 [Triticum dicoccoides]
MNDEEQATSLSYTTKASEAMAAPRHPDKVKATQLESRITESALPSLAPVPKLKKTKTTKHKKPGIFQTPLQKGPKIMQTDRTTVLHSKVSSVCSQMSFNNSENVDPNKTTTGTQVTNHQTGCSTLEGAVRNTLKRKKVSETTRMKKGTQAISATTGNNILRNSGRET